MVLGAVCHYWGDDGEWNMNISVDWMMIECQSSGWS